MNYKLPLNRDLSQEIQERINPRSDSNIWEEKWLLNVIQTPMWGVVCLIKEIYNEEEVTSICSLAISPN